MFEPKRLSEKPVYNCYGFSYETTDLLSRGNKGITTHFHLQAFDLTRTGRI